MPYMHGTYPVSEGGGGGTRLTSSIPVLISGRQPRFVKLAGGSHKTQEAGLFYLQNKKKRKVKGAVMRK